MSSLTKTKNLILILGIAVLVIGTTIFIWRYRTVQYIYESDKQGTTIVSAPYNLFLYNVPQKWLPTGEAENILKVSDGKGEITARVLPGVQFQERFSNSDLAGYVKIQKEKLSNIPEISILKEENISWGGLEARRIEYYVTDTQLNVMQITAIDKNGNLLNLQMTSDVNDWSVYLPLYEKVIQSTSALNR